MAKKKTPPISAKAPVVVGTSPQPTTVNGKIVPKVTGGPAVTLFSLKPQITVTATLRAPIGCPVPQPIIDTSPRPGMSALTRWSGRNPYTMALSIKFDERAARRSVEPDVAKLFSLALRHKGDQEPPAVQLTGPVPPAPGSSGLWRISEITESDPEVWTAYNDDGRCTRIAFDVTLVELTVDKQFEQSLTQAKGIKNRHATIRKGETLHEFAKRVLHDRSKAADIARANSLPVSYRAKAPGKLRLP